MKWYPSSFETAPFPEDYRINCNSVCNHIKEVTCKQACNELRRERLDFTNTPPNLGKSALGATLLQPFRYGIRWILSGGLLGELDTSILKDGRTAVDNSLLFD